MLTIAKDFSEHIKESLKHMVDNNLDTMEVKKEGTEITMLLLEKSLITNENKSRIVQSYEQGIKTFYLLR